MILKKNEPLRKAFRTSILNGFTSNFMFENGKLINAASNDKYDPEDCILMDYSHYEEKECPNNNNCSLLLIKCNDRTKGTLLCDYRNGQNKELISFIDTLISIFKA